MKTVNNLRNMGGGGNHTLAAFLERGMAAQKAADKAIAKAPEQMSEHPDDFIPPRPWGIEISGNYLLIGSVTPEQPDRVDETVFRMEYGEDEHRVNRAVELARAKFIVQAVNRHR
jgi:hypothetical protein